MLPSRSNTRNKQPPIPTGFAGAPRLTLSQDETANCTACFHCATACPAHCIYIEPGDAPGNPIEKFAAHYEIDALRCVYCGLCVETCPCDAIGVDSGTHPGNLGFSRKDLVEDKTMLIGHSRRLQAKGKKGFYDG